VRRVDEMKGWLIDENVGGLQLALTELKRPTAGFCEFG
jgi:hypothetical protein